MQFLQRRQVRSSAELSGEPFEIFSKCKFQRGCVQCRSFQLDGLDQIPHPLLIDLFSLKGAAQIFVDDEFGGALKFFWQRNANTLEKA